jgi:hypothetical protein
MPEFDIPVGERIGIYLFTAEGKASSDTQREREHLVTSPEGEPSCILHVTQHTG